MRTLIVGWKHPVCCGNDPKGLQENEVEPHPSMPRQVKVFWKRWGLFCSDKAVIVLDDGELVGFFRFSIDKKYIYAIGTWVHPDYRGQGMAKKMWTKALKSVRGKKTVTVTTVSEGGGALVVAMKKLFPNKKFNVN